MMRVLFTKRLLLLAGAVAAGVVAAGAQLHLALAPPAEERSADVRSAQERSAKERAGLAISAAMAGDPIAADDDGNGGRRAHSFYFSRGIYSSGLRGGWRGGGGSWATDFPEADRHFLVMLRHLTNIDAFEYDNAIRLTDPNLRRYPFLYLLEVGRMSMPEEEVQGLRDYLLAGGFLMIDDFWGTIQWNNFEQEMMRVFPEYPIVDIPLDHPIFSTFYQIDEILQVPVVYSGLSGGPTHEQDGYTPHVRGIFDDTGRLMAVINWNTDIGDAWEHADNAGYPVRFSTFAFQLGVNFVIYAMSN